MIRAALAIALLGLASCADGRDAPVHVPFVGCPADGQTGDLPPPKSGRTPAVPADQAAKLAYYSGDGEFGVLGPPGWHCVELSGSSGSFLVVTPDRHRTGEFLQETPADIRGPAIQLSVTYGGTSGRYTVAEAIARYFPARKAFVQQVIKSDRDDEIGILAKYPLRTKTYPTDIVKARDTNFIRFVTPAGMEGEGTRSRLLQGDLPIDGFRQIVGPTEEPELVGAEVRLPLEQANLIETILAEAAK